MTKIFIASLLTFLVFSCKESTTKNISTEKINTAETGLENLIQAPIVNDALSDEQLNNISHIHKTFNEVFPVSLEETIANFKRDENPSEEITIWLAMANAYESFVTKDSNNLTLDKKKEVFKAVFIRSMMSEDEFIQKEIDNFRRLSKDDINYILQHYKLQPKPIIIAK
ncbi:hypothetical protein [uncultured Winogradskyella sp.]|uniref:hypothetical protein n=1 Tax=uncultured Winogradskyella sp. TaxID=395353 RepID=UPI00262F9261|nr:hypothetical protein [uncultured Winogradskyella sp.]